MAVEADEGPALLHDSAQQVPLNLLGKRIVAAAIKGVSHGEAMLRPGRVLLLMMEDGTVVTFDNSDNSIATTGGLNGNGWDGALGYANDIMRTVHVYRLDEVDGQPVMTAEKLDYV